MLVKKSVPKLIENNLTRLNKCANDKESPLLMSVHHFNEENGKERKKRSDGKRNMIKVLELMVSEIEIGTLAWGQLFKRHDGVVDFYTRGIEYLAVKLSMATKTVKRALSDANKAGYLSIKRMKGMGKDGKEIRFYSLRTFTTKFFRELGFKKATVQAAINRKLKKNRMSFGESRLSDKCRTGLKRLNNLIGQMLINPAKKRTPYSPKSANKIADKDLISRAHDLAVQTGQSVGDIYRELLAA